MAKTIAKEQVNNVNSPAETNVTNGNAEVAPPAPAEVAPAPTLEEREVALQTRQAKIQRQITFLESAGEEVDADFKKTLASIETELAGIAKEKKTAGIKAKLIALAAEFSGLVNEPVTMAIHFAPATEVGGSPTITVAGGREKIVRTKTEGGSEKAGVKGREVVVDGQTFASGSEGLEYAKTKLGLPAEFGKNDSAIRKLRSLAKDGKITFTE